jgi:hypothetical protein
MTKEKEDLIHYIAAKYIMSEDVNVSINANASQIDCLQELLEVSKKLKIALDEQKDFDNVVLLTKQKNFIANKFTNLTGIKWRL